MTVEDDRVRARIAEIMSSAGLGYNRISHEILYLMPDEFITRYIQLWEKAYGTAPSDQQGQQSRRTGDLGRAETKTAQKGTKVGAGSGGVGKRYKNIFVIRDSRAFDLKSRIDKRLRAIARDIRTTLEGLENGSAGSSRDGETTLVALTRCGSCGRILSADFRFCPWDGSPNGSPNQSGMNEGKVNDK